ncbi:hypothetical protein ABH932_005641, partial [Streptacidiphilus sp. MAP5-52]
GHGTPAWPDESDKGILPNSTNQNDT